MKHILITGAGGSAASNFVNALSLVTEKYYLVGTDTNPYHLALSPIPKKYLISSYDSPDYITQLNTIIAKEKTALVYPQTDVEVAFFAKHQQKIHAKIFLPDLKTITLCQDKGKFITFLEKQDIPVAESIVIKNREHLLKSCDSLFQKHKKLWIRAVKGAGSKAALPIVSSDQALFWVDYWQSMWGIPITQFMLSEFLPGKEYAFQSIWQNGSLIVSQARERLEYVFGNLTVSGQSSSPSVARTVTNDTLNKIATNAVRTVDKHASGVFCVDLKENATGVPCVTEINLGRFFTTSNFFAHAGLNMPELYIKLAFDEPVTGIKQYNNLEKDLYWIRLIDMGYKLFTKDELHNQLQKVSDVKKS